VELYNQEKKGVIVSLEDPIEYLHTDRKCIIKQREIGVDTLSFANAARNALRQDPTVLVIGEILDQATMEVAITAAESGILVFTTLHAANSTQALDRVISFFPPEVQRHMLSRLALVLRGVTTQLLLPRMDKSGFTLISEVVTSTDAVKSIIRNGDWAQIRSIIQTGKNEGMQTFKDSLENAYRQGLIDAEYLLYEEVR
jgi:twitching motility protein PilT